MFLLKNKMIESKRSPYIQAILLQQRTLRTLSIYNTIEKIAKYPSITRCKNCINNCKTIHTLYFTKYCTKRKRYVEDGIMQ